MTKKQKKTLVRILITGAVFAVLFVLEHAGAFASLPPLLTVWFYLAPYLLISYDVILKAVKNISHGTVFDENLLMLVATVAAFAVGEFSEALAVMLFYQVGELFQSYAVGKSRRSITDMLDIVPEYANIEADGQLTQVDPDEVAVGTEIVVLPGERIPLDGVVTDGSSFLDTKALTGEPVPRSVNAGDEIVSGCVNGAGTLRVRTTKAFENSTVTRILELVENAGNRKAKVENFITRFARVYTPFVTCCALLLAVIPPLFFGGAWTDWLRRACIFLVISCPCALVISVPLGFFGGIGASSRLGVLVKGSNFLEALSQTDTLVFDKTGTLTKGEFRVTAVCPESGSEAELLEFAALGEGFSTHPIAHSIREAYGKPADLSRVADVEEQPGLGIRAKIDGKPALLGSGRLLDAENVAYLENPAAGTVVYLAAEGRFLGSLVISDTAKPGAKEAVALAKRLGVSRTVMLTGDRRRAAEAAARELGVDEVRAELLPAGKVEAVESLLQAETGRGKLAYVGDGINDAPVLARADVGVAMGSMGSDAAIEAADIVILDDDLRKIPATVRIARRTMGIVRANIVLALAVKALVMVLGALGLANMWMAVFADVGVAILAILNSMRTLRLGKTE